MRKVRLKTAEGRAAFARKFAERTQTPLPDWLLSTVDVIGFQDGDDLIGGYLVKAQAPFRYIDMLPAPYRDTPHVRLFLSDSEAVELICMWLDHGRMTPFRRTRIYLDAVFTAIGYRRRWMLAGSVSERVASLQKKWVSSNGLLRAYYLSRPTLWGDLCSTAL